MERKWKYLENQFENSTRDNYKKAIKLSNYHDADLKAKKETESLLDTIYERYHPLHVKLVDEYNSWKSAGGSQEGQTLNLNQMLDLSYGKMPQWDINIQATGPEFMKGTPNYLSIFMNGRSSFTQGSIDDRINAYDTLAKNMMPYGPLDPIRVQVEEAFLKLDNARDKQAGAKGIVKTSSGNVEAARVEAMTMQWRNLGFAMDAFWDKPRYIESMFDLQTLRESRQVVFTGTLDPSENEAVLIHTFLADDELRLKNDGNETINFYLATMPNGKDSTPITVAAHAQTVIAVSEFGITDYGTHRYLTALNLSASNSTHYEVELY